MSLVSLPDDIDSASECLSPEAEARSRYKAMEEKIYVTVRVRPLNEKELARNEFQVWDCPDESTVAYTFTMPERSSFPQKYDFDQVFGLQATTQDVYDRGAKDVALSALKGKNATIFAYGQTSSGKTYTMHGIMESAADDIFGHIQQNAERIYLLKFSALEIYNEVTSDLLNPESGPLRLLDDPERGTIIEKLEEKIVRDKEHLQNLVAFCESHRQVGETSLNDYSSRSHQIVRLTIESSPRIVADDKPSKSLLAVLNFVDLAGSERASLTNSEGTRLKEGCYINRSLLTLSSVIRKLSEGSRARPGHVPYRDSKLTRILQNSLGGNARTAIICTMSCSNRHVEQTRNTLFFASCAKEVTNRARVNTVISDKDLIKQLKREVALLEAKLRMSSYSVRNSSDAVIIEKDQQIQKMQDEIRKAFQQRDMAQSKLDNILKQMETSEQARTSALSQITSADTSSAPTPCDQDQTHPIDQPVESINGPTWTESSVLGLRKTNESVTQSPDRNEHDCIENQSPNAPHAFESIRPTSFEKHGAKASAILLKEIYKLEHLQNELAHDANRALEAVQKEVECLRLAQSGLNEQAAESVAKLQAEIHEIYESQVKGSVVNDHPVTKDLIVDDSNKTISLKEEIQRIVAKDKDKDKPVESENINLKKLLLNVHSSVEEMATPNPVAPVSKVGSGYNSGRSSFDIPRGNFTSDEKTQPQAEENIRNIHTYVADLKERVAKLQYQKELLASRVMELENNGSTEEDSEHLSLPHSPERWKNDYSVKLKQILELWDACHVSIVHRSQFYLLFQGDPADAIYIEVELRRLLWLRNHHLRLSYRRSPSLLREERGSNPWSSVRMVKRERESLVRYMKMISTPERDRIYEQWGIPLDSKQRKVKVAYLVWTDHNDEDHVRMSAELVSRLVGLWKRTDPTPKEMIQLSFSPPTNRNRFGWNSISNLFN
uniref:Kinesin 7-IIb protein n=1 Tax=Marsilea vestita TaxID=59764 RepID=A0A142KWA3_MARVE|nr:kinesin 7-IIb protein [Marsilea vestita]